MMDREDNSCDRQGAKPEPHPLLKYEYAAQSMGHVPCKLVYLTFSSGLGVDRKVSYLILCTKPSALCDGRRQVANMARLQLTKMTVA